MKIDIYPRDIVLKALKCHITGTPVAYEREHCSSCPLKGQGNCVRVLLSNCAYYLIKSN